MLLQKELTDPNFKLPKKWLIFVKVAYEEEDSCYNKVETTSNELFWFFGVPFHFASHDEILKQSKKAKSRGDIPEHVTFEEIERIMQDFEQFKSRDAPVYFVKNDDGSIVVRKSILNLRHVVLGLAENGKYEIVDECGIGVFDFLKEFVIGFSPEQFLKEHEQFSLADTFYATHGNIDLLC